MKLSRYFELSVRGRQRRKRREEIRTNHTEQEIEPGKGCYKSTETNNRSRGKVHPFQQRFPNMLLTNEKAHHLPPEKFFAPLPAPLCPLALAFGPRLVTLCAPTARQSMYYQATASFSSTMFVKVCTRRYVHRST